MTIEEKTIEMAVVSLRIGACLGKPSTIPIADVRRFNQLVVELLGTDDDPEIKEAKDAKVV